MLRPPSSRWPPILRADRCRLVQSHSRMNSMLAHKLILRFVGALTLLCGIILIQYPFLFHFLLFLLLLL